MEEELKRRIKMILAVADDLVQGKPLQTLKLRVIIHMIGNEFEAKNFYRYLLEKSYQHFCNGESLSPGKVVSDKQKKKLYEDAICNIIRYLSGGKDSVRAKETMNNMSDYIYTLSSGYERIWVHAKRLNLEDTDLMLIHGYS